MMNVLVMKNLTILSVSSILNKQLSCSNLYASTWLGRSASSGSVSYS